MSVEDELVQTIRASQEAALAQVPSVEEDPAAFVKRLMALNDGIYDGLKFLARRIEALEAGRPSPPAA